MRAGGPEDQVKTVQRCNCGGAACKGAKVSEAALVDQLISWPVGTKHK